MVSVSGKLHLVIPDSVLRIVNQWCMWYSKGRKHTLYWVSDASVEKIQFVFRGKFTDSGGAEKSILLIRFSDQCGQAGGRVCGIDKSHGALSHDLSKCGTIELPYC